MNVFSELFFKKKQPCFYEMLIEQSEKTITAINELDTYVNDLNEDSVEKIRKLEREADQIRKNLIEILEDTFITPFEREDIFSISRGIDDLLDYCYTTVEEIQIFGIEPNQDLKEIVATLSQACYCIHEAVLNLRNFKSKTLKSNIIKAKKIENKSERLCREALLRLVEGDNFSYILKMREVYRHLSHLAEKIDVAANLIGHVMVKMS